MSPERICAFTFTNKAAGEISSRLEKHLGEDAHLIQRGTIHSFCVKLLREHGDHVGLTTGFGIADEEYQMSVLRRIGIAPRWHKATLKAFTSHRFVHGFFLDERDRTPFRKYTEFLTRRNLADFDMLVLKTAELFRVPEVADKVRGEWDSILVDEFQDLTPVQYGIVRDLASKHRDIFAVGDDEQSIYSWAGASPAVFTDFLNDFALTRPTSQLAENRRCPREVVDLARRLININTPIFEHRSHAESVRPSSFPIDALKFRDGEEEHRWIIADIRRDREAHKLDWQDYALLYRTNELGNAAEAQFLTAAIPCRMAHGRAMSDDPVVRYVVAALRVISSPMDPIFHEGFLQVVLPRPLFDSVRAKAQEKHRSLLQHLEKTARKLPRDHADGKKLRRAIAALRNLEAIATKHQSVSALVDELLSQKVGEYRTILEDNYDELSDPAANTEVDLLATKLSEAFSTGKTIWIPRIGGVEIAIKGILAGININRVQLGGVPPANAVAIGHSDCSTLGIAVGVFKAAQLMRSRDFTNYFRDYTAVDIETTDNDINRAELVEIAAVRVRDGKIVDEFRSLVKPSCPISGGAFKTHSISEDAVRNAPSFAEMWPAFHDFCRGDLLVAHNGHGFDFPILRRMAGEAECADFSTYDTLVLARELRTGSASLVNLAKAYGIETGRSHHALDDTRTLAQVFLALGEEKVIRARKTALDNLLDYLGIGLALSDRDLLGEEAERLRELSSFYSLGKYTRCLEFYRRECESCLETTLPPLDELIERLGGEDRLIALRTEKSADERYPEAMQRLRPLLAIQEGKPLAEQITGLLERVALSR
ncbi:MAG: UvrD-helicase domain-containing protein, partial [Gemmatimonadota bacterium]|nr:UvrD-helicase domain-containing protein [Gemmatimonadota bacterium]